MTRPAPKHLPGLDGVRGIAILLVMLLHFVAHPASGNALDRLVARVANYGVYGVDLFFVLSGFLITGILHDTKAKAHYYRNFYVRRTLRIFPLYYGVLAVLFVALPLVGSYYPDGLRESQAHQVWLWTYLTNVYVASKGSWEALPYVSHFWSLAVEEHFYLVWPFVVKACSARTTMRVCLGAIALSLVLRLAMVMNGANVMAAYVLTPCRLDCLCVGSLLALFLRTAAEGDAARVRSACRSRYVWLLGSLAVVPATHILSGTGLIVFSEVRGTLLAVFFGAVVVTAASAAPGTLTSRLFGGRALAFFGKLSYGLYVYHGILAHWLNEVHFLATIEAHVGNRTLAAAVFAAVGTALSVAISIGSYELFEKRFLSLKTRFPG